MKSRKFLSGFLILCLLASQPVFADDGDSSEPSAPAAEKETKPTEKPTAKPTEKPTEKPADKTVDDPTEKPESQDPPSSDPTPAPKPDDTTPAPDLSPTDSDPDDSDDPDSEPSVDPAIDPEETPAAAPSEEPTDKPTVEPDPTVSPDPTATPEPIVENIVISGGPDAAEKGGIWVFSLKGPGAMPSFTWTCSVENAGYIVKVNDVVIADGITEAFIQLTQGSFSADAVNTFSVGAILEDGSISWTTVSFKVEAGRDFPGGFPGRFPGGGKGPGGNAPGEEDMGFHVTPGVALTSSHTAGTKDMTLYGSVSIPTNTLLQALVRDDHGASLELKSDGLFSASVENGKLLLTAEESDPVWRLNASILDSLSISGVTEIVFSDALSIPTSFELKGSIWGKLRSEGFVDRDCVLSIDAAGISAIIDGETYSVSPEGEILRSKFEE